MLANEVVPNPEDMLVFFTHSLRGRPAIMANGVRFLIMSENKKKILWRCSSMATKKIKCPARITMLKETPPKFIINKAEHVHAELKRNKYGSNKQHCFSVSTTKDENIEIDGSVSFEIIEYTQQQQQQQQHHHHQHHNQPQN